MVFWLSSAYLHLLQQLPVKSWMQSKNNYLIDGRINIDELINYKIFLPKGNYETIGGYIIEKLGKIPENGNTLNSEFYKIRVLKATSTQVQKIQIIKK